MSNNSAPRTEKQDEQKDHEQHDFNQGEYPKSKHKFEGWPILWILIVIFLIAAVIWYTGSAGSLLRWIDR